jgi:hypothetical protein
MATLETVPDEILAAIFSKLPLSKEKVTRQIVCKRWKRVLAMREAHSLDTHDEDLPFSGKVLVDGEQKPFISERIIKVLRQCTLNTPGFPDPDYIMDVDELSWLPLGLEALGTWGGVNGPSVANLPFLGDLKHLVVNDGRNDDLSANTPNLKKLEWSSYYVGRFPAHLERLTKLERFIFHSSYQEVNNEEAGKSVGQLPVGCEVVLQLVLGEAVDVLNLDFPHGMAGQITRVELFVLDDAEAGHLTSLDFEDPQWQSVKEMTSLQSFLWQDDLHSGETLIVNGIESLPASCKRLEFFGCSALRMQIPVQVGNVSACMSDWIASRIDDWVLSRP